jgi:hypothetical protein
MTQRLKVSDAELTVVDDDIVQSFEHVGAAGQPTFHNLRQWM